MSIVGIDVGHIIDHNLLVQCPPATIGNTPRVGYSSPSWTDWGFVARYMCIYIYIHTYLQVSVHIYACVWTECS